MDQSNASVHYDDEMSAGLCQFALNIEEPLVFVNDGLENIETDGGCDFLRRQKSKGPDDQGEKLSAELRCTLSSPLPVLTMN